MIGILSQSVYIFRLQMFAGQVGETGTGAGEDPSFELEAQSGDTIEAQSGEVIEVQHD